jgi:hypothetical protein
MRYVKDKVASVFNTALRHEGIWRNGEIAPRILNPDNRAPNTHWMVSKWTPRNNRDTLRREKSHAPEWNQAEIFRSSSLVTTLTELKIVKTFSKYKYDSKFEYHFPFNIRQKETFL